MNWDAIGAIAEAIGSIAVVVTIAFLGIQVRQSTAFAKIASVNQSRNAVNEFLRGITENTDTVDTYTIGMTTPEELEFKERIRFDLIIFQMLRHAETQFFEHREGLISDEIYESGMRQAMRILATKGGRESWDRQGSLLTTSFSQQINTLITSNDN